MMSQMAGANGNARGVSSDHVDHLAKVVRPLFLTPTVQKDQTTPTTTTPASSCLLSKHNRTIMRLLVSLPVVLLLLVVPPTVVTGLVAPIWSSTVTRAVVTGSSSKFSTDKHKILVLGDSGFLGKEIVRQLEELGIPHVKASRSSTGLDLTAPNAADQVAAQAQGCTAVISTVGSLLGTKQDQVVNAANGIAAQGASQVASIKHFVAIGNDPKVRQFSENIPMLQSYTQGKIESEAKIQEYFPNSYTIVQPSLIHGGDEFSATPPRIPSNVGQAAEDILGLYPFQAASEALPGIFGVALQAPVSRERVARAAINAALGLTGSGRLDSRDAIVLAASKRPAKEIFECDVEAPVTELKREIYELGDCGGDTVKLERAFELLEQIEKCNANDPSTSPILNGRWDFCFDVEADIGTGVVKDILEGRSPIQLVFDLQDLHMEIANNQDITIHVNVKVLNIPMPVKLTTKILVDDTDPTGTTFLEQFQGLEVMGVQFPVPSEWQRSRPLEFSYLDETMLIARGNGGEPHYLKRDHALSP